MNRGFKRCHERLRHLLILVFVIRGGVIGVPASSQTTVYDEYAIKVAYLYNLSICPGIS